MDGNNSKSHSCWQNSQVGQLRIIVAVLVSQPPGWYWILYTRPPCHMWKTCWAPRTAIWWIVYRIWLVGPRNHSIHPLRSQKDCSKRLHSNWVKNRGCWVLLFKTWTPWDTSKPTNLLCYIPKSKAHYWWSTTSLWDGLAVLWKSYVQWMNFRVAWWKTFRMELDSLFVTCTWTPFPFFHKKWLVLWVYVMSFCYGLCGWKWGGVHMLVKTSLR